LEQLNIKRFLTPEKWEEFNQGEHSFYINAVDKYFAPSSRSSEKTDWNEMTIPDYFKTIEKNSKYDKKILKGIKDVKKFINKKRRSFLKQENNTELQNLNNNVE